MTNHTNINGKPWAPSPASVTPKARAKNDPKAMHAGWCAEGVSPATIEAARLMMPKGCRATFDAESFASTRVAHRERVTKPLCSYAAAEESAALAKRLGWLAVTVIEVKRGQAKVIPWIDGVQP